MGHEALPEFEQIVFFDIREHDVLVMGDAQFTETEIVSRIGKSAHLVGGGIARSATDWFQGHGDG